MRNDIIYLPERIAASLGDNYPFEAENISPVIGNFQPP